MLNMSRKAEQLYNSNLQVSAKTPNPVTAVGICASAHHFDFTSQSQPFKIRDSSTGGKQPLHGPRRLAFPGPVLRGDFVTNNKRFAVTKSEIQNYKVICKLASSKFQRFGLCFIYFCGLCSYFLCNYFAL